MTVTQYTIISLSVWSLILNAIILISMQISTLILLIFIEQSIPSFKSHNLIIINKIVLNITSMYSVVIAGCTCDLLKYDTIAIIVY